MQERPSCPHTISWSRFVALHGGARGRGCIAIHVGYFTLGKRARLLERARKHLPNDFRREIAIRDRLLAVKIRSQILGCNQWIGVKRDPIQLGGIGSNNPLWHQRIFDASHPTFARLAPAIRIGGMALDTVLGKEFFTVFDASFVKLTKQLFRPLRRGKTSKQMFKFDHPFDVGGRFK